jgi:hypothetical protein
MKMMGNLSQLYKARFREKSLHSVHTERLYVSCLFKIHIDAIKLVLIRTANRHRYSGRADQGERVISPKGTRQKSDRKLAIRSAPITLFLKQIEGS